MKLHFLNSAKSLIRQNVWLLVVMSIWYLSMFPGSLPFDSSEAIRMIQRNQTIDWWSATYFWFLKITSIHGATIAISSAIGYLVLVLTLSYFVFSFSTISRLTLRRARLVLVATPIVSVFGLTVSHDVFIISGILLILGTEYRFFTNMMTNQRLTINYIVGGILLTNTRAFPVYLAGLAVSLLLKRKVKLMALVSVLLILLFSVSHVGIERDKNYTFIHVLSDIKCVVQHKETKLSTNESEFLSRIAPLDRWKRLSQCSNIEKLVRDLDPNYKELNWNKEFVENYVKIVSKSPAILMQAKLQRSVVALPPPFFFTIPRNMVSSDLSKPIGLDTNWSLQENGPGLLHPSIDEISVNNRFRGQDLIRTPALAGIYMVNQASWFWGWGGLWLWPTLLIPFFMLRISRVLRLLEMNFPIIILHASTIAIGPASEARHVGATIIAGISLSTIYVLSKLEARRTFSLRDKREVLETR